MRQSMLIVMSISGSVVFMFYILLYAIAKKFFSKRWRYNILKMALLFFLFPFPIFKYRLQGFINSFIFYQNNEIAFKERYFFSDIVIQFEKELYVSNSIKRKIVYLILMGCVAFLMIIWHLYKYYKLRRTLNMIAYEYNIKQPEFMYTINERLKNLLDMRKKYTIVFSEYIDVASVIGLLKPVIYIPQFYLDKFSNEDLETILMHEIVHIKHKDLLFKFLSLLAIALHWFNPLSYLVFYEISNMSEVYCDDIVIQKKGKEYIKKYGNLLIEISEEQKPNVQNVLFLGIINNGGIIMKKRIMEMKTERKRILKKISVFIGILICLGSASTTFAYNSPSQIDMLDDQSMESAQLNPSQWAEFSEENPFEICENIPSDTFFTDENGNVFPIDDGISIEKEICSHKYVPGTFSIHTSIGKGCRIEVYNASRCNLCGKIIKKEHLSTIYNDICLH